MMETPSLRERAEPENWPAVATVLTRSLENQNYEEGVRALLGYYKNIKQAALDDEPSQALQAVITKSYNGQLPSRAMDAARRVNAAGLIYHRQIACALAQVIGRILTKVGNSNAEDMIRQADDLESLLDPVLSVHPFVSDIELIGSQLEAKISVDTELERLSYSQDR